MHQYRRGTPKPQDIDETLTTIQRGVGTDHPGIITEPFSDGMKTVEHR
jgi:hypothetical protein